MPSQTAVDKRVRLLEHYKSKPEYEKYMMEKTLLDPSTPRVVLTKRSWESEMFQWRTAMRGVLCKDVDGH